MNKQLEGFAINIFPENDYWVAHFVELPKVSAAGDTIEQAIKELEIAWSMAKDWYIENSLPLPKPLSERQYSGQFNVRIDKRVHAALVMEAAMAGITLNALVAQKLYAATQNSLTSFVNNKPIK